MAHYINARRGEQENKGIHCQGISDSVNMHKNIKCQSNGE